MLGINLRVLIVVNLRLTKVCLVLCKVHRGERRFCNKNGPRRIQRCDAPGILSAEQSRRI